MEKPVLTLHECVKLLRTNGIKCSPESIKSGIKDGTYPFGRIKSVGPTGRETTEIFRVRVEQWLCWVTVQNVTSGIG